jgi:hypothetical protein
VLNELADEFTTITPENVAFKQKSLKVSGEAIKLTDALQIDKPKLGELNHDEAGADTVEP